MKVIYVIYILIISMLIAMLVMCSSPGGEEIQTKYDNINVNKLCLEGNTYYFVRAGNRRGGLAPVLKSDGSPVKCESSIQYTNEIPKQGVSIPFAILFVVSGIAIAFGMGYGVWKLFID